MKSIGTFLAGFVISTQYIATVLSRPRGGRMADTMGPKQTVIYGMISCAASGFATFLAQFFRAHPLVCLALILVGRSALRIRPVPPLDRGLGGLDGSGGKIDAI